MAVIDPAARRSADVTALEETVVAKVTERDFSAVAQRWPELWRRLALELAERLRERSKHVKARNDVPRLFIGCSAESLTVARSIQDGLSHDNLVLTLWTNNVFTASHYPIEDLEQQLVESDFATIVLAPEDNVFSRGIVGMAPRDNVIFELGLFMGALLRNRVLVVSPREADLKIPTDLLGLTPLQYPLGRPEDLAARIAPTCNSIRRIIAELGPK
jgi:predicted nucleotide-binding protein